MVNSCANPQCAKPLHYLREGRIFVFEAEEESDGTESVHRIKHFWLCGACSETMLLEKTRTGVMLVSKRGVRAQRTPDLHHTLAS